jgi:uncharacterized membrane-anchored protein YhcB (DUF1043 family)
MTGMTEQTLLLIGGLAVFLAALIGFVVGRSPIGGKTKRVAALEAEVSRQQDEIAGYRRDVESHFDKTATLVASMAGSYKDLFEHLSSGYEHLSSGSARQLFRDRVVGLLVGNVSAAAAADVTPSDKVSAALIAAGAQPLEPSSTGQAADSEPAAAAGDTAPTEAATDVAAKADGEAAATPEGAPAKEAETNKANDSKPDGEEKSSSDGQAEAAETTVAGAAAQDGAAKDAGKGDRSTKTS